MLENKWTNNPKNNDNFNTGPLIFMGSPYTITGYFVIVILLSLFAFFKLFPDYGLIISKGEIAIENLSTQDTIVQITGNLKPVIIKDRIRDSFALQLNVDRKIFKDTAALNGTSDSKVHAVSFSMGLNSNHQILWLIIIVGILGASIHGITSLSEFVGNGSFDSKWSLWYYLRPFVGALLSLIFYLLIRAGIYTIDSTNDLFGLLAIAGIIGMFSKQALYKISDIANAIFTSQHEENLKGKLTENSGPKISSAPQAIVVGAKVRSVTLTGEHFMVGTKVYHSKEELPMVFKNPTEIEVTLNEESIQTVGDLVLRIVNPPPDGGETTKTIKVINSKEGDSENSEEVMNFDELEVSKQYLLIDEYINEYLETFRNQFKTITGAYAGKKKIGGNEIDQISLVLQVNKKEDQQENLPEHIEYKGYKIPTDVEVASTIKPSYTNKQLEKGVSRISYKEFGTLGFPVVIDDELHILSCFHVFFNEEMSSGISQVSNLWNVNNQSIVSPPHTLVTNNEIIGKVVSGEISDFLDVAIMKPNDFFIRKLNLKKLPKGYRILRRENENKIYLKFWGQGSNRLVLSKLLNISVTEYIDYPGVGERKIRGLIKMEKGSIPGDSGAAVYDSGGVLIGIVLGSDSHFSYVISAYNIFSKTNYKPLNI